MTQKCSNQLTQSEPTNSPPNQQQYANAEKFNARIRLHAQCATNKYPWPLWVFDQFEKKEKLKILELGCGTGMLWQVNATRIPLDWDITLSDFSEGMLKETKDRLKTLKFEFKYEVINAESIPYPDNNFDAVIANHLLYHVPDLEKALAGIARVLKPGGKLYSTTVGKNNMLEMKQLVTEFTHDQKYQEVLGTIESNFSLDNGTEYLNRYFQAIHIVLYQNRLCINDAELLAEYVLSCNGLKPGVEVLNPGRAGEFKDFVQNMIKTRDQIVITTESGMFICEKGQ